MSSDDPRGANRTSRGDAPRVVRPRAGRPRVGAIDDALRRAVREVLVEVGYGGLNLDLVARRAGVSRPAIYRRWPDKAFMVVDSVFEPEGTVELPDSGDFAADLAQLAQEGLESFVRPEMRAAVPGLLADQYTDPMLRQLVLDRLEQPTRLHFSRLVQRAIADGQVREGIDPDAIFDALYGALLHRVVARGIDDERFAGVIADLLVRGTARIHP